MRNLFVACHFRLLLCGLSSCLGLRSCSHRVKTWLSTLESHPLLQIESCCMLGPWFSLSSALATLSWVSRLTSVKSHSFQWLLFRFSFRFSERTNNCLLTVWSVEKVSSKFGLSSPHSQHTLCLFNLAASAPRWIVACLGHTRTASLHLSFSLCASLLRTRLLSYTCFERIDKTRQ